MNNICRLCLSVSNYYTYQLSEECDVLRKLSLFLSVQITLNENLPKSVCTECLGKIEDVSNFQRTVTENQQTLNQHFVNGINDLEMFYLNLKNGSDVKEEIVEMLIEEKKVDVSLKNELEETQPVIKVEQIVFEETYGDSSDDDASPLITKKKKKRRTVKMKNKSKAIKKINSLKEFKSNKTVTESNIEQELDTTTDSLQAKENMDTAKDYDMKYKCLTCFNFFDSKRGLVLHYKQEHGKNVVIDQTIQNCYGTIRKDGNITYKCGKCGKIYVKKRDIRRHMISHTENRPFVCNICGRTYKLAADIMMHGRAHEGAVKFTCMYECGFSTAYRAALKDHERKHRKGEFKFKCDKCGKGFQVRTHFEEHDNVHKGIKPFVCDICGSAFNASRYLQSHRATVHPKAATLQRYVCVHCSLPCGSKRTLHTHLKEHGITKSYLCDFCGKSLSSLSQYNSHKRAHLGEKPFSCSNCGKSFTNRTYLHIHERTHTGEKRYACAQCGKRYTQRSTLVRHMRQHTGCETQPAGEESLECSKCHKNFKYRSQVVTHEKVCENLEGFKTE